MNDCGFFQSFEALGGVRGHMMGLFVGQMDLGDD